MIEPSHGNNGVSISRLKLKVTHLITFILSKRIFFTDYSSVVIKCVAYGTLAHVFQNLWNSTNANVVLCVTILAN